MKDDAALTLADLIACLPELAAHHARTSLTYQALAKAARAAVTASALRDEGGRSESLGALGEIVFPYVRMGAIDTLDLFGLDELIIFSFYWTNRTRYRTAADIGANLGLHSLLMSKCGWQVKAYEPDPQHAARLRRNLELNRSNGVEVIEAAVSDQPGALEFVRVLGNTTSSHLAGAKANPYGELERFPVRVESIAAIVPAVDFIKMDAEGQEKIIILGMTANDWRHTDMMVEVGTAENAAAIHAHLGALGINAFAQKRGWSRVETLADMPASYKEGSLFISARSEMPWT